MRLVCEAVLKCAGASFECLCDFARYENRSEWGVAAGDSLSYQDEVGFDIPVLHREWLSRPAHAAHDLIGDEEDVVAAADFGDTSHVAVGRSGGTERGANDWLEDEGRDGLGVETVRSGRRVGGLKQRIEIVSASEIALRKFQFERAVVAKARSDMAPFGEQWLI